MRALGALITAIMIPIAALNLLGGLVGGIWLVLAGEWSLVVAGVVAGLLGLFVISLALMPGMLLLGPGAALAERNPIAAAPFLVGANVWTLGVVTVWCVGVFLLIPDRVYAEHLPPALLFAYATATGPWSYMASKEAQADPNTYSMIPTFFAQLGSVAMMLALWLKDGDPAASLFLKAFLPFMALCLVVQIFMMLAMAADRRRHAW
jgi:hypothetical protein